MFYKKGTFLAFAEAKLFASFAKSSERKMSDFILISDGALPLTVSSILVCMILLNILYTTNVAAAITFSESSQNYPSNN
jgi:hypothetical protein